MPRPRYENLDGDKKQRLTDAARREFARHGYELASINTILDEAGFSKGSFYYHFDDKADLAITLIAEDAEEAAKPMRDLKMPNTAEQFWAELKRISMRSLETIEANRTRYEAFIRIGNAALHDEKLTARVIPLFAESRRRMAGFMERGVSIGALRNDLPIGALMEMIQALKGAAYKALYPGDQVPSGDELHEFTDLIIDLARRVCSP
jgi:AcrR family transcriptional regulator